MAKTNGGRWVKGQSGNPNGRPKLNRGVVDLARAATAQAVDKLVELLDDDDPKVALRAATVLLDRAWGTAPTAMDVLGAERGEHDRENPEPNSWDYLRV